MSPAEHLAHFLKLAARPFDRNRTPVVLRAVSDEDLRRDVTPPPTDRDYRTDFSDNEPTNPGV